MVDYVSQIYQLFHVHSWICVVCVVPSQKILHETVQLICMDTRLITDRGDTVLPHDPEYF